MRAKTITATTGCQSLQGAKFTLYLCYLNFVMINHIKRLIPNRFWPRLLYHRLKGSHFAKKSQYPAKSMQVIGITGTDGKTTTSQMIFHCLRYADKKTGMLTTTTFAWNNHTETNETHKTSLSPKALNHYLLQMQQDGVETLVLEASSHALDQGRLAGIPIHTAVITNLSHEHLDYHHTMEKYRSAKAILFRQSKYAVVNGDDPFLAPLTQYTKDTLTFGSQNANDVFFTDLATNTNGLEATIHFRDQQFPIFIPMFGEYNILNAIACISACITVGLTVKQCIEALSTFHGVPGRMEKIDIAKDYTVLIDYTITPQAFRIALPAVRKIDSGRLIAVFGACGDRDKEKRPVIGRIASELCDLVIVTDDEPYFEDPIQIREMIKQGVPEKFKEKIITIDDRREAIKHALKIAQPHDVIIVMGMGNETSRVVKGKTIEWSERDVIKEEAELL